MIKRIRVLRIEIRVKNKLHLKRSFKILKINFQCDTIILLHLANKVLKLFQVLTTDTIQMLFLQTMSSKNPTYKRIK